MKDKIVRHILIYERHGKKMKSLDSPGMRKKLEKEGISYKVATQEYDPKTGEYNIN